MGPTRRVVQLPDELGARAQAYAVRPHLRWSGPRGLWFRGCLCPKPVEKPEDFMAEIQVWVPEHESVPMCCAQLWLAFPREHGKGSRSERASQLCLASSWPLGKQNSWGFA